MKSLKLFGGVLLLASVQWVAADVTITSQPKNASVSLGATVQFTVTATSTAPPITYQWRFNDAPLDAGLIRPPPPPDLSLTNITLASAGPYAVVARDLSGSVTSQAATLDVDPTFTKITTGPVVTDLGSTMNASWGDYDGDGYPDLFVPRYNSGRSALYRNNGDGTFTSITTTPFAQKPDTWMTGSWADLDGDGRLDLIAARGGAAVVYFNNGDGTFSPLQLAANLPQNVAVIDYNRDGLLDLLLAGSLNWPTPAPSLLYRNNGDRTFTRMTSQEVGSILNFAMGGAATCADYDDDGWVDVFCANNPGSSRLFHNDGTGRFASVTNVVFQSQVGSGAWGDYDNDGRVDLCAASWGGTTFVYRNLGDGEFERAAIGQSVTGPYYPAAWADYDNDGFLDLFLGQSGGNALYHNNGDGTFTRITTGSIVTDVPTNGAVCWAILWFDYDNDGFLDLHVSNSSDNGVAMAVNFLYHNNGNSNAWLKVKLIGTASSRDAVGAKVRVQAKYAGQVRWQRRDVTGGDALNGNQLYAHFGLGDATNVTTLRIEWPSGVVQELSSVTPKQFLTIWEPPALSGTVLADGSCQLTINAEPNRPWRIEASTDLKAWQTVKSVTSNQTTFQYTDTAANAFDWRFYRVVAE